MNNKEIILKNISNNANTEYLELVENFETMLEDYGFLMSLNNYEQSKFLEEANIEELEYAEYLLSEEFIEFLTLTESFNSMNSTEQNTLLNEALKYNDVYILTEASISDAVLRAAAPAADAEKTVGLIGKIKNAVGTFAETNKEAIGGVLTKAASYAKKILPPAAVLGAAIGVGAKIGRVHHARKRYARFLANQKQNELNALKAKFQDMSSKKQNPSKEDLDYKQNLEADIKKLKNYGKKRGLFAKHKEKKEIRDKLSKGQLTNAGGFIVDSKDKNYFNRNKKELNRKVREVMANKKKERNEGKEITLKNIENNAKIKGIAGGTINDKGINQYLDSQNNKEEDS